MHRQEGHLRPSNPWALLGALACGWMMHTGCVSLDLPPERIDSGAGGADAPEASGGNSGGDAVARDATVASDVPAASGTGGIDVPGSGGSNPLGTGGVGGKTGGIADALNGTGGALGGAGGTEIDVGAYDAVGGAGGPDDGGAGSGGAAGSGGTKGTTPDAPADAPSGDLPPDAPVTAPTAGLVVYWPCEGADGTNLQDKSGGGNNGQIVTASPGGYSFEAGKIGNGLTLSQAQGAYVSLGAQVFRGTNALTIALWLKLVSVTTWQRLFDIGVNANLSQNATTGTAYFSLVLKDYNGKLGLTSSRDGYNNSKILTTDALPIGVWKHVAVVAANGGATIYIDGSGVATTPSLPPPSALGNLDYAFIGKSQFSGEPSIDAEIDSFRVYNRALSADEIRTLFDYSGP